MRKLRTGELPGRKSARLRKLDRWKKAYAIFLFCAATAIALPAQTFTNLVIFNLSNGGAPTAPLVQGLDGEIYQVRSDGTVTKIVDDIDTPFAVVVQFIADQDEVVQEVDSFESLRSICDRYRDSENLFYAFRIDGHFDQVHTRAMQATLDGLPLAKAAAIQPEFHFKDTQGTLVGIWAPEFASSLNISGYHFHFLSDDRTRGGHLLECRGRNIRVRVERLTDFHLCLPESEEFLRADLTKDPSKDLAYAEQAHKKEHA